MLFVNFSGFWCDCDNQFKTEAINVTSGVEMLKNVQFSTCASWRHIGEVEVQLNSFLTAALY